MGIFTIEGSFPFLDFEANLKNNHKGMEVKGVLTHSVYLKDITTKNGMQISHSSTKIQHVLY